MNEDGRFTCEINIFVKTPHGFDAHIKSVDVQSDEAIGALSALSNRLYEEGFMGGRAMPGRAPAEEPMPFEDAPKPKPWAKPAASGAAMAPLCDYCGGPTWDNRKNKRNPKGPDFKCKDKDNCGAAAWLRDGELSWAPPEQG